MIFVYPYKKSSSHFEILQSMRWIRKFQPDAVFYTIGDEVDGALNIPCKQFNNIRGVDVTNRILTFARKIGGEFIYMNDDFYINENFDFNKVMFKGELTVNPVHPPHYQEGSKNTIEFLRYNDFPILNYECHQPVKMDSKKLLKLFNTINWKDGNHFIKSIYLNVYKHEIKPGENVKMHHYNLQRATTFLEEHGCLSIGDGFLIKPGIEFLKR